MEAIVAENPYASLHELAKKNIRQWYTLPAFPFLNAIELRVKISDTDFTVNDLNLESVLSNTPEDIPLLFLTSEGDQYIQQKFTMDAYQLFSGEKDLLVGSGSHGMVYVEKRMKFFPGSKISGSDREEDQSGRAFFPFLSPLFPIDERVIFCDNNLVC